MRCISRSAGKPYILRFSLRSSAFLRSLQKDYTTPVTIPQQRRRFFLKSVRTGRRNIRTTAASAEPNENERPAIRQRRYQAIACASYSVYTGFTEKVSPPRGPLLRQDACYKRFSFFFGAVICAEACIVFSLAPREVVLFHQLDRSARKLRNISFADPFLIHAEFADNDRYSFFVPVQPGERQIT